MFNSEPPTKTLLRHARPKKAYGKRKPRGTRAERFAPGMTFAGRYRLVHLLGKGGMGAVYRADDLRLGQTIALKFLSGPSAPDRHALARFREEARLARRVSHSGVCRIFDFGESGDKICLCASLAGELMALPQEMQKQVALFFEDHIAWLEGILKKGKQTGEFSFSEDTKDLAYLFIDALQGALIVQRATLNPAQLERVIQTLTKRL